LRCTLIPIWLGKEDICELGGSDDVRIDGRGIDDTGFGDGDGVNCFGLCPGVGAVRCDERFGEDVGCFSASWDIVMPVANMSSSTAG
jgi:hypothetical protein